MAWPVQPVLLTTDLLQWLIVAVPTALLWRARNTPRLAAAFRALARRPVAMASLVFLAPYLPQCLPDADAAIAVIRQHHSAWQQRTARKD